MIFGSWLHYTFIVFEFENEGKISFDFTDQGIRISTDERIMEDRKDTAIDYQCKCNIKLEDIL
jgi:hypothetical protein